jgi:putative two-component system hydrogenase maturation factor HypX/HoxX
MNHADSLSGMRVLFVVSAHNSLSQRAYLALTELGHSVSVAVVDSPAAIEAAVALDRPQLVVCPMLKTVIPESVWSRYRCLVVHPGPEGDRGASSLDWAIEDGVSEWGVTVLEASGELDGGDVWATRSFPMRTAGKSSLYRHEVRSAAIAALCEAVERLARGGAPAPPRACRPRPTMRQADRALDWSRDGASTIVRRVRAAEGHPGVLDGDVYLFGAHPEPTLRGGPPGAVIGTFHGAVCRATVDGAVWITHAKAAGGGFKLPAASVLEVGGAPEVAGTWREIRYEEHAGVGYLQFDFYNGAMSTGQCTRLLAAYRRAAARRSTRVIVLMGGADFFSNGIHLNVIEAAEDPGEESWRNLVAIDDLVRAIVCTDSHLVISALSGDAAAGGVPLALAADHVVARDDVVLNPYYRHMGGLYGSEYWTYLMPRRVGTEVTAELTGPPFEPIGTRRAVEVGLLDAAFGSSLAEFRAIVRRMASRAAADPALRWRLAAKREMRARDERERPLHEYRRHELDRSRESFFGPDAAYHQARHRFVHKLGAPCAIAPGTGHQARMPDQSAHRTFA